MTLVHKADDEGFRKFGCPKYLASIIEQAQWQEDRWQDMVIVNIMQILSVASGNVIKTCVTGVCMYDS